MTVATSQLWAADMTCVRLATAFIYLAVVPDALSRDVVGRTMADHLRARVGGPCWNRSRPGRCSHAWP